MSAAATPTRQDKRAAARRATRATRPTEPEHTPADLDARLAALPRPTPRRAR